jgi:hypothetical protein
MNAWWQSVWKSAGTRFCNRAKPLHGKQHETQELVAEEILMMGNKKSRQGSSYATSAGAGKPPLLIQDSLRYRASQMHVDAFRFDLAAILTRDEKGRPLPNPPMLRDIESDPFLAGIKAIAEAWESAGLYHASVLQAG